jgi:hypothetical protein
VVDWLAPSAHGGSMNLADLSLNAAVVLIVAGALFSMRPRRRIEREPGKTLNEPPCSS